MNSENLDVRILAIETSGSTCSVALHKDGMIAGEYSLFNKNVHDRLLSEFIRRLLEDRGTSMDEINAVAVSAGPGSFTGIRIGASVAKALCFEDKPKLISVPTLAAIAFSVQSQASKMKPKDIIAAVPSHKNLIYQQSFNLDLREISDAKLSTVEELMNDISDSSLICGPLNHFQENRLFEHIELSATIIAKYAVKLFNEGSFTAAEDFKPVYVQEFIPKIGK
jgi:tRNA threonylcarbamoyladenosine biosynthesis protein TsaB